MFETIVVLSVVLLASIYVIRRIVRAVTLKGDEGACGSCPMAGNCTLNIKGEDCENSRS